MREPRALMASTAAFAASWRDSNYTVRAGDHRNGRVIKIKTVKIKLKVFLESILPTTMASNSTSRDRATLVMGTRIPIFCQVVVTIVVAENDTPIRLQIEPCNLSTIAPLVINQVTDQVDLAKKANPCLRNEEHKQEQERTQPNCR